MIRSAVSGLKWPAIPSQTDSGVLALQFQLEQSQWHSAEIMRSNQLRQAGLLVSHVLNTVPYYQAKLSHLTQELKGDIDWGVWQQIPILERSEVQDHSEALVSNAIPSSHLPVASGMTSGSTGRPISLLRTRVTGMMWDAFTLRSHLWYGRDMSRKRAAIRYFDDGVADAPLGARQLGWSGSSDMFLPHGEVVALNVSATISEQVAWLIKEQPEYLVSYPSNLSALAEHCIKERIQFPQLKEIATIGELLSDKQRDVCREAFGLEIIDTYSAEEIGYIAMQCPNNLHYHVQSESVLLEVLNEQNQPCKSGETGRVVLTTLHNFAKPLIRYAIGDYAEVGGTCACGRNLMVLNKVIGRSRNMFIKPNGEKFWPSIPKPTTEVMALLPVSRQVQYVQKALDCIEIRVASSQPYSAELEHALTALLQKQFAFPYQVIFTYHQKLVHSTNGKFEEFLCELS